MFRVNGGFIGVSTHALFFTTREDLPVHTLATLGQADQAGLGEHGRLIEKEQIAEIQAVQDGRFTTVIRAKGLAEDIGVHSDSLATQQSLIAAVQALKGQPGHVLQTTQGLLFSSGKYLLLALCAALITGLLHYLVISLAGQASPQSSTSKEGMLFALANLLGPTGTLLIGGAITLVLALKALSKARNRPLILRYTF
ncbi:MAG: hypothetical protein ABWY06_02410 [Pseudomonas sp.]|uniref:hypothetical protein n=1 Tax=Pseudomonas sp. TaxID=306 RepID=UPI00339B0216